MREEPAPGVRIQLYEKSGLSSKIWTESGPISTKKIPDPDQSLEIRTKVGALQFRTGQVKTRKVRTSKARTGQVRPGQVEAGHVGTC